MSVDDSGDRTLRIGRVLNELLDSGLSDGRLTDSLHPDLAEDLREHFATIRRIRDVTRRRHGYPKPTV